MTVQGRFLSSQEWKRLSMIERKINPKEVLELQSLENMTFFYKNEILKFLENPKKLTRNNRKVLKRKGILLGSHSLQVNPKCFAILGIAQPQNDPDEPNRRCLSEETRHKISLARKAYFARRSG